MSDTNSTPIYRITDLPESDRPRERLSALGPQSAQYCGIDSNTAARGRATLEKINTG